MANIKFELFRNRRKFNIVNWLKAREDKSYESFVSFLASKSVLAPGEEYFNKALELVQSMEQREQEFQEKKVEEPKVEKKETVPKTRRRRRKKSQDES